MLRLPQKQKALASSSASRILPQTPDGPRPQKQFESPPPPPEPTSDAEESDGESDLESGGGVPPDAIPVTWITSEEDLENVTVPHDAPHLTCEECETAAGVVVCEADEEVLCGKCCRLLYPPSSTGAIHRFFAEFRIRVIVSSDTSGAIQHSDAAIPYYEVTEDAW